MNVKRKRSEEYDEMEAGPLKDGAQLAVRLPPDLLAAAKRARRERDQTIAALLRVALRKMLREEGFLTNGETLEDQRPAPRRQKERQ